MLIRLESLGELPLASEHISNPEERCREITLPGEVIWIELGQ